MPEQSSLLIPASADYSYPYIYHIFYLSKVVRLCYFEVVCEALAVPGLAWSTVQCSRQTAQRAPLKIFKAPRPYVHVRTQLQLLPLQMLLSELPWSHWLTRNQLSAQMTHLAIKNLCVEIVIKNPILIKPWYWSCHSYFLL